MDDYKRIREFFERCRAVAESDEVVRQIDELLDGLRRLNGKTGVLRAELARKNVQIHDLKRQLHLANAENEKTWIEGRSDGYSSGYEQGMADCARLMAKKG